MVKRYTRRYRRRAKRIMRNYFKAKLDTVQKVQWTEAGANFVTGSTGNTRTVQDLLQLCNDWQYWRQLFHTYKLTGIAVRITPNAPTSTNGTQFAGAACLSMLTTRESANWTNAIESNFSFMLSPVQIQRKYKGFNGGLAAWHGTDDTADLDGKFVIETDGNPTNGATTYMVQFTFYVTFKNTN